MVENDSGNDLNPAFRDDKRAGAILARPANLRDWPTNGGDAMKKGF
jgi:hypothetical protein